MKVGYKIHEIYAIDAELFYELMIGEEEIEEVTADDIDWL